MRFLHSGEAAIGAKAREGGFTVYTLESLELWDDGRLHAQVWAWEAAAPPEAWDMLVAVEEAYVADMPDAEVLELCGRHDCAPSQLARAESERALAMSGGDVMCALRWAMEGLDASEARRPAPAPALEGPRPVGAADVDGLDEVFSQAALDAVRAAAAGREVGEDEAAAFGEALKSAPWTSAAATTYMSTHPGCFAQG